MLKRVFPERQHKSGSRSNNKSPSSPSATEGNQHCVSPQSSPQRSDHNVTDISALHIGTGSPSSTNSSPLKSSYAFTSTATARLSSSSSSSPVKSEAQVGFSECVTGDPTTQLSKSKHISRSCSSTEFQSLKLGKLGRKLIPNK